MTVHRPPVKTESQERQTVFPLLLFPLLLFPLLLFPLLLFPLLLFPLLHIFLMMRISRNKQEKNNFKEIGNNEDFDSYISVIICLCKQFEIAQTILLGEKVCRILDCCSK
eukprot:GFUD01134326.1.p1 GENE.GFUD01134326.1~~GFUD01134326.1.p1  ORF type:complete len:110 (-),score=5.20 GFUD01134326.1:6-335(-)